MPSVHLQPGRLGQFDVGLDADPRHHGVGNDFPAALVLIAAGCQHGLALAHFAARDARPGQHLDPLLAVEVVQELGQVGREHAAADAVAGEGHHHLLAVHRQGGGHLRPDEPAADDREPQAPAGQRPQPLVIVQGAEVDDVVAAEGQAARGAAGGEEELVEGVDRPLVVGDALVRRVQRSCLPAEVEGHSLAGGLAPDALQRFALPEPLGEGRAVVGGMRVGTDQADRATGVYLADSADGGIGGHPAADDQVRVVRHGSLAWSLRSTVTRMASSLPPPCDRPPAA